MAMIASRKAVIARCPVARARPAPKTVCRSARDEAAAAQRELDDAVKQLESFSAGLRADLSLEGKFSVSATQATEEKKSKAPAPAADSSGLEELNQDTFYDALKAAGNNKLVVVDFYTDWCGPCKIIYPELVKMSQEMTDVKFFKFNCNKANKDLGVKLGIKVAPTFHLYKNSEKVADMTGAKVDKLTELIMQHK